MNLYQEWLEAKEQERKATELRRNIEDQLFNDLHVADLPTGSKTIKAQGFKVKVTKRINHRINGDLLQDVALENGIDNGTLSQLFRWKPEINQKQWEQAPAAIKEILGEAITTSMGRPSFSIEQLED